MRAKLCKVNKGPRQGGVSRASRLGHAQGARGLQKLVEKTVFNLF